MRSRNSIHLALLGAEESGGQPEAGVVRQRKGLIQILHRLHRQDGNEQLLAHQFVVAGQAGDDGRPREVAVGKRALADHRAARTDLASAACLFDVSLVVGVTGTRGQWTEEVLALQRIPDAGLLGALDQPFEEAVGHAFVDVHPRAGRALVAVHTEGRAVNTGDRPIQVGAVHHDGRVLAAHLDDAGLGNGSGELLEQVLEPDVVGPGEGDPLQVGVGDEGVAHDAAAAGQQVQRAGRQPRLLEDLRHQHPRQRRIGRGLRDHRVAGDQGGGDGRAEQGIREIPGGDDPPDAVRAQHAGVAIARGKLTHRAQVAVVRPYLIVVVVDEVSQLLDLAQSLHPVLAHLEDQPGGELIASLPHAVGGPP